MANRDPRRTIVQRRLLSIARSRLRTGFQAAAGLRDSLAAASELRSLAGWAEALGFPKIASAARSAEKAIEGRNLDLELARPTAYQQALRKLDQQIEELERQPGALEPGEPEDAETP